MQWNPERANGRNREIVLARALIERIQQRHNGVIPNEDLARNIRESLRIAAAELGIGEFDQAFGVDSVLVTSEPSDIKTYGKFTYDRDLRIFTDRQSGHSIELPNIRGQILGGVFFVAPEFVTTSVLCDKVWGVYMPNSLKSGVLGLRKRLREFSADAKIESHPGFGYRFQDLSLSIS